MAQFHPPSSLFFTSRRFTTTVPMAALQRCSVAARAMPPRSGSAGEEVRRKDGQRDHRRTHCSGGREACTDGPRRAMRETALHGCILDPRPHHVVQTTELQMHHGHCAQRYLVAHPKSLRSLAMTRSTRRPHRASALMIEDRGSGGRGAVAQDLDGGWLVRMCATSGSCGG
jgi:hypothetical protein